jgi:hypothetical protein
MYDNSTNQTKLRKRTQSEFFVFTIISFFEKKGEFSMDHGGCCKAKKSE